MPSPTNKPFQRAPDHRGPYVCGIFKPEGIEEYRFTLRERDRWIRFTRLGDLWGAPTRDGPWEKVPRA